MKTIERRWMDRSTWERGPWDDEPDKVQWPDPTTGLPCLAVRHERGGHWCGYVGFAPNLLDRIPRSAALFDGDEGDPDLRVHGGITFSAPCREGEEERGVCHVPEPGEPDPAHWLGFDCAHCYDLQPAQIRWNRDHGFERAEEVYRTLGYVREQCARLAAQIHAALNRPEGS